MPQEQLHDYLLRLQLCAKSPQSLFIFVGGRSNGQLRAELLRSRPL